MFSHSHEVEMTRRYRKDHDLMGYEADDLLSIENTITEKDIWQCQNFPDVTSEKEDVCPIDGTPMVLKPKENKAGRKRCIFLKYLIFK